MSKSKNNYIKYLNELAPPFKSDEWIMSGKRREGYAFAQNYGQCMRKHDPIAFEVGFYEWKLNN